MTWTVTSVTDMSIARASAWSGTTDAGEFVYSRYRAGRLSVDVAASETVWMAGSNPPGQFRVFRLDCGSDDDSVMIYNVMRAHTFGVFTWPEEVSK